MADTATPFLWVSGGERLTPDAIKRRRLVAEALLKQGNDYSPIKHPLQGAARVVQALVGGWQARGLDQAEAENAKASQARWGKMLSGLTTADSADLPATGASPVSLEAGAMGGASGAAASTDGPQGGSGVAGNALDLIMKHESAGKNVHQNVVPAGGGYNPSTGTVTGPSSASGYFQMIDPTWRSAAAMAGIDTKRYPTAISAPYEVQRAAAHHPAALRLAWSVLRLAPSRVPRPMRSSTPSPRDPSTSIPTTAARTGSPDPWPDLASRAFPLTT